MMMMMRSRPPPPLLVSLVVMLFHHQQLIPVAESAWYDYKYECLFFRNKVTVQVINRMPSGFEPIKVRCKSKDDDLGWHTLGTNQSFSFRFCMTPYFTKFYCTATLPGQPLESSFIPYDAVTTGSDPSCGSKGGNTCVWEMLSRKTEDGWFVYGWKKN